MVQGTAFFVAACALNLRGSALPLKTWGAPRDAPAGARGATNYTTDDCTDFASDADALGNLWGTRCLDIPTGADHVKVKMGDVVDYFKPVSGYNFCDMLQSNDKHQFSPDAVTWYTPTYFPNLGGRVGGSWAYWPRDNIPGDERAHLSFWGYGGSPHQLGCCHYSYSDTPEWYRSFTMSYCSGVQATTPAPASATGDPHLQNMHGQRFDLMRPGKYALVHVPRGQPVEDALLVVEADARQVGARCSDMYFTEINVTGKWTKLDLHYNAQVVHDETPQWSKFGPIELKVAHGHTEQGVTYLNFYVKHLGRAGFAVGGLLGEDDHGEAATLSAGCRKTVSLAKHLHGDGNAVRGASVATAMP